MGIVMGIDHGNGHVKAQSGNRVINLPSAYTRPYEEGESYAVSASADRTQVFEVEGAGAYWWGNEAVVNAPTVFSTSGNRYDSNEFRLLSNFAVSTLLPQNRMTTFDDIVVVTGYPSQEKGTRQEEMLREAFLGKHEAVINGQRKVANVTTVHALPQPLGTVMYLYLNDEGYVADEAYETCYCGIIDIGSGTTDLDGVNALKRQKDDYATIRRGMNWVYEQVAQDIFGESDAIVMPSVQQVEQQVRAGNKEYHHSERYKYQLDKYVKARIAEFVAYLDNQIKNKWSTEKMREFDRLILTGGGAANKYVASAFQAWFPDITIVSKPQEANAIGFYRYGLARALDEE